MILTGRCPAHGSELTAFVDVVEARLFGVCLIPGCEARLFALPSGEPVAQAVIAPLGGHTATEAQAVAAGLTDAHYVPGSREWRAQGVHSFKSYGPRYSCAHHPTEPLASMRIVEGRWPHYRPGECAVWNVQDGTLAWEPRDALSVSWTRGGTEAVVLTRDREFGLERWSWAGRERIARVSLGRKVTTRAIAAPHGAYVVAAGPGHLSLWERADDTLVPREIQAAAVYGQRLRGPVFARSGTLAVLVDPLAPPWRRGKPHDEVHVANLLILDMIDRNVLRVPLTVSPPEGPRDPADALDFVEEPRVTDSTVSILLPNGTCASLALRARR